MGHDDLSPNDLRLIEAMQRAQTRRRRINVVWACVAISICLIFTIIYILWKH